MKMANIIWSLGSVFCWYVSTMNAASLPVPDQKPYHDYPPIEPQDASNFLPEAANSLPGKSNPPLSPSYHGFPYNYKGFPYNYVGFPYGMSYGYPAGMSEHGNNIENFHCPKDGIFYRDEYSFFSCYDNDFRVLYCAPGSRNKGKQFYDSTSDYKEQDFCAINLNWHGYGNNL